jgi:hypothetical protein
MCRGSLALYAFLCNSDTVASGQFPAGFDLSHGARRSAQVIHPRETVEEQACQRGQKHYCQSKEDEPLRNAFCRLPIHLVHVPSLLRRLCSRYPWGAANKKMPCGQTLNFGRHPESASPNAQVLSHGCEDRRIGCVRGEVDLSEVDIVMEAAEAHLHLGSSDSNEI